MLDLAFVRNNLPLVEDKLRQRGMDPVAVLKDRRNKLTEEFQQLRKAQQDTAANLEEQKLLKSLIEGAEKQANDFDAQLREVLTGIPDLPNDSVPVGNDAEA